MVTSDGRIVQMCGCAWDRLFRAAAELICAGEMDSDDIVEAMILWQVRGEDCPSARAAVRAIQLAYDEPACGCNPYEDQPCGHEVSEEQRRARVAELLTRG